MAPTAEVWTEDLRVRGHEVTPHGTVSVPALCTYLPEVAGHHADALGVSMQSLQTEDRAWVLAHLHLTIDQLPSWNEDVVIETWPSGLDGLYATREFVLSVEETPVARATSAWLVLDTERRRPSRPPRMLYSLETPDRPPVLSHDWDDLPPPQRVDHTGTFDVRYHDLDLNRHVNSARLVEWVLETLPVEHLNAYRCTNVILQFRAEATLGTPVHATAQVDDAGDGIRVRHLLRHADENRVLTAAQTTWTPHP